jgi:hypothetical protein
VLGFDGKRSLGLKVLSWLRLSRDAWKRQGRTRYLTFWQGQTLALHLGFSQHGVLRPYRVSAKAGQMQRAVAAKIMLPEASNVEST